MKNVYTQILQELMQDNYEITNLFSEYWHVQEQRTNNYLRVVLVVVAIQVRNFVPRCSWGSNSKSAGNLRAEGEETLRKLLPKVAGGSFEISNSPAKNKETKLLVKGYIYAIYSNNMTREPFDYYTLLTDGTPICKFIIYYTNHHSRPEQP